MIPSCKDPGKVTPNGRFLLDLIELHRNIVADLEGVTTNRDRLPDLNRLRLFSWQCAVKQHHAFNGHVLTGFGFQVNGRLLVRIKSQFWILDQVLIVGSAGTIAHRDVCFQIRQNVRKLGSSRDRVLRHLEDVTALTVIPVDQLLSLSQCHLLRCVLRQELGIDLIFDQTKNESHDFFDSGIVVGPGELRHTQTVVPILQIFVGLFVVVAPRPVKLLVEEAHASVLRKLLAIVFISPVALAVLFLLIDQILIDVSKIELSRTLRTPGIERSSNRLGILIASDGMATKATKTADGLLAQIDQFLVGRHLSNRCWKINQRYSTLTLVKSYEFIKSLAHFWVAHWRKLFKGLGYVRLHCQKPGGNVG